MCTTLSLLPSDSLSCVPTLFSFLLSIHLLCLLSLPRRLALSYRIIELLELEGIFKDHLVHCPYSVQGHYRVQGYDQGAQSSVQPHLSVFSDLLRYITVMGNWLHQITLCKVCRSATLGAGTLYTALLFALE